MASEFDVAVVGGGIVGMATAMALSADRRLRVVVIEAEGRLAEHQTGHNSGVIHSGLYYKPGSAKARNCADGRELMVRFCQENGIAHERCGKLVVATDASELSALDELHRRGVANGLTGLRRLGPEELREHEPHVQGVAGLLVPQTGIADYRAVTEAYADRVRDTGGEVRTFSRLVGCVRESTGLVLQTTSGELRCRQLVNCAGLQCDRVARLCGVEPGVQIVPFRGEYYQLKPGREHLVRNLIYPVPDPRLPFLGVHFTRMVHGGVEAGPNAVLALAREGYRFRDVSIKDVWELVRYPGFWRMAGRFWKVGLEEMQRSLSQGLFWRSLRKLVPAVRLDDLVPGGAGVRAQAVAPDGKLVDDFRIIQAEHMVHVLNAPSPGATASISIGRTIALQVREARGDGKAAYGVCA